MTISHKGLALGAAGLAAGLALGVTGLAGAASPSPSPANPGTAPDLKQRFDRHGGPFGKGFKHELRGGYGGLVTAIDSDSVTVRTPGGTQTIALNGSTTYYTGKTKATRSAVGKGSVVRIRLVDPQATKKVAAVVSVVPAHIAGWVTKVSDDTITVTDPSGFTRTIRTTGSTTYLKDGASATRTIVTVGTMDMALGTVDDNGTTLDATQVAVGRPGKGDRPGPPDGAAFDGPMGDGPMGDGPMDDGMRGGPPAGAPGTEQGSYPQA